MTFTVKFHSSEESRPQIQVVGIHNAGLKFDKKVPVFSSKALSFLEKLLEYTRKHTAEVAMRVA